MFNCVANVKTIPKHRSLLRHVASKSSLAGVGKFVKNYPKIVGNRRLLLPHEKATIEDKVVESLGDKLVYSSYLSMLNKNKRWKVRKINLERKLDAFNSPAIPLSLKYVFGREGEMPRMAMEWDEPVGEMTDEDFLTHLEQKDEERVNLPYSIVSEFEATRESSENEEAARDESIDEGEKYRPPVIENMYAKTIGRKWLSDYECFEEYEAGDESEVETWDLYYGTADNSIPPSQVPCGGCGAHLHCQSQSVPGYIPKEIFQSCRPGELRSIVCQRCNFMKRYDTALCVNVRPDSYEKLLCKIKGKRALVLLMVDMTDFPCSIWPDVTKTIGDKPIIVVGNKVDLIQGDHKGWLAHALKSLKTCLPWGMDVKATALISAKTGYGVEELINMIHKYWNFEGDIYLVGCTNVGKSTLFNALLQSDLCRVDASDLMQRATTSPWPGTTLNLLKFPMLRPAGWRLSQRTARLVKQRMEERMEKKLENLQKKEFLQRRPYLPQIIGNIRHTFKNNKVEEVPPEDLFLAPDKDVKVTSGVGLNPNNPEYKRSKWFYDTPGVVHPDQVIHLLTTEELNLTISSELLKPKIYSIYPGQTFFIGGLARLDNLSDANTMTRFVIFAAGKLPVTVCYTKHAEELYERLLGGNVLCVPRGTRQRLDQWPGLQARAEDFIIKNNDPERIACDIVLSNAGWVGVEIEDDGERILRAWTPQAKGIHVRKTPLLKYAHKMRRKRMMYTPEYHVAEYW